MEARVEVGVRRRKENGLVGARLFPLSFLIQLLFGCLICFNGCIQMSNSFCFIFLSTTFNSLVFYIRHPFLSPLLKISETSFLVRHQLMLLFSPLLQMIICSLLYIYPICQSR